MKTLLSLSISGLLLLLPGVLAQDTVTAPEPGSAAVPGAEFGSGSMEVGFRWLGGMGGDFNTYRSVVNLGEGPRLLNLDWSLANGNWRFLDRLDLRANNWGGDPYNSSRIAARKNGLYDFTFDYANIAYFNFLPSFANPRLEQGIFLNQRSFDTRVRTSNFHLDLLPGRRVTPYVGYTRNANFGTGITTFVSGLDEFPVANRLTDHTDNYRGGVVVDLGRVQFQVEQGGTTFADNQEVFTQDPNPGNRATPFLGRDLFLTGLMQAYGVRSESIYTSGFGSATPADWISLYANFRYSQPQTTVNYSQANAGQFVALPALQFFNGQLANVGSDAKMPHTLGHFSFELRPLRRLRIVEAVNTDRLHNAAGALMAEQYLLNGATIGTEQSFLPDRLVLNYNQQELNAFLDVTNRLTLRGGHRFVWGDARTRPGQLDLVQILGSPEVRRHVGLAGANFRAAQRLSFNASLEVSDGQRTFFRTGLQDFRRGRVQARYQAVANLVFTANFNILENRNPTPGIDYNFLSRQNTVGAIWTPGRRLNVLAEYSRATVRSEIDFIAPQSFDRELSFYRDNAHIGSAMLNLAIPARPGFEPRLTFGGSFFTSSGSRPTSYYQPLGRLALPVGRGVFWSSEWRWYALSQNFYVFEGFRNHQFTTGLRLTM